MIYLEILEPMREWTAPTGELSELGYAQLPFRLLARDAGPFDAWRRPGRAVPARMEPLWREAIAGWQLCAFHAVNASTAGNPFAERILALQTAFLEGLRTGAGAGHEAAIRRLYPIAWQSLEVETPDGQLLEVPADWRAAIEFLMTGERSPYRTEGWSFAPDAVPIFPEEADVALAHDLERAWAGAADHFAALLPEPKQS
jgi:hypothetical protein